VPLPPAPFFSDVDAACAPPRRRAMPPRVSLTLRQPTLRLPAAAAPRFYADAAPGRRRISALRQRRHRCRQPALRAAASLILIFRLHCINISLAVHYYYFICHYQFFTAY